MSDSKPESIHDDARRIAGWMIALLWLLVLGGGTWLAQHWFDARERSRAPTMVVGIDGRQTLVLHADRLGQYLVTGRVNGREVDFLIDTGASGISLPASLADSLSASRGPAFEVLTANGRRRVFATTLDSVSIGPFVRHDVPAHLNPGLQGDTALLGMTFLKHYELLHRGRTLTISGPINDQR